ncbi:MAG: FxsA family protein [Beijerinckiaceae bacterium]
MRSSSPLLGLLTFAVWVALEIVAFNLVASWTGGGAAFFLLVMKSVLGVLFVKRVVSRKIFDVLRRGGGGVILEGREATEAFLKGLGGFLLIWPGFVAGLAGLALLTPGVRGLIARRSGERPANPREIDLEAADWRDVPEAPPARIEAAGERRRAE